MRSAVLRGKAAGQQRCASNHSVSNVGVTRHSRAILLVPPVPTARRRATEATRKAQPGSAPYREDVRTVQDQPVPQHSKHRCAFSRTRAGRTGSYGTSVTVIPQLQHDGFYVDRRYMNLTATFRGTTAVVTRQAAVGATDSTAFPVKTRASTPQIHRASSPSTCAHHHPLALRIPAGHR